jgi:hypothetical protein
MKNKQLNEEISRIKGMMKSIINEDFEITNSNDTIVDCDMEDHDSDTMQISVIYDGEDKYETYLISVDFTYERGEAQSYDHPGADGGATGDIDGVRMIHPEQRELTGEEIKTLLSNKHVDVCVSRTMEEMEIDAYERYVDNDGPDPDDYYDRMRDDD